MGRVFGALESGLIGRWRSARWYAAADRRSGPALGARDARGPDRGDRAARACRGCASWTAPCPSPRASRCSPACRCSRRWPGRARAAWPARLTRVEVPAGTDVVRSRRSGRPLLRHRERPARRDVRRPRARRRGRRGLLRRDRAAAGRPRTATVTALEDSVLQVLDREDFLAALDGSSEVRTRAEDVPCLRLPVYPQAGLSEIRRVLPDVRIVSGGSDCATLGVPAADGRGSGGGRGGRGGGSSHRARPRRMPLRPSKPRAAQSVLTLGEGRG